MECSYELLPCDEDGFADFVESAYGQGYHGVNVTTPHKQAAFRLATAHSESAILTGNANLLLFGPEDVIYADNTDVAGFSRALTQFAGFDPAGTGCVILGSGSVAASVLLALSGLGCRQLTVAGRSSQSLAQFALQTVSCRKKMDVKHVDIESQELLNALSHAALVVNCTSAGMAGREGESPLSGFYRCSPGLLAMELIYAPRVTRFMAQMRNCGATSVNGMAMLACQASAAFELLSGQSVDPRLLLAAAGRH
jgi:shikimate dehydrogenase